MTDLIPFATRQLGNESVNTVNARDLYAYLEMTGDYNLWITRALKRANLIENMDFIIYYQVVENRQAGRPAKEHHLTFDAAKQVAMMSSATKGRTVREWFIQKEKELTAMQTAPQVPQVRDKSLQMIIEMAVQLDAARILAEEAKADAATAQANALRALETQCFFSIAEYVYVEKLQAKIPENAYRACSDHLRLYCLDKGIPFRKIAVGGKRWDDEYAFHISVYVEVLPGWIKRRFAQDNLSIIRPQP